jgi:DNA-binding CsgD family transcriptional regulator
MVPPGRNQKQSATPGLRGIIVAENDGAIRCAGTQAELWLQEYFLHGESPKTLPSPVNRWLRKEARQGRSLEIKRNGTALVITLVKGEQNGPHCLLLEERYLLGYRSGTGAVRLTNREREILCWVAQGKTNWAIGKILDLSPATVGKHLQHIYSKLGVENRTAAVLSTFAMLQSWSQKLDSF